MFRIIAYVSCPAALYKIFINIVQLITAAKVIAKYDVLQRSKKMNVGQTSIERRPSQ